VETNETPSSVSGYVTREYHFDLVVREHRPIGRHFGQVKIASNPASYSRPIFRPLDVEIQLREQFWAEPQTLLANVETAGSLPIWQVSVYALSSVENGDLTLLPSQEDWLAVQAIDEEIGPDKSGEERKPKRSYSVRVVSWPDAIPASGSVRIQTTHPESPEIVIPVNLLTGQNAVERDTQHDTTGEIRS
jgi:hypothetical protein